MRSVYEDHGGVSSKKDRRSLSKPRHRWCRSAARNELWKKLRKVFRQAKHRVWPFSRDAPGPKLLRAKWKAAAGVEGRGSHRCRHATLISRNHVLDVDESILSSSHLEQLERVIDEIAKVQPLPLAVLHQIPNVCVAMLEDVKDWKKLPVVRNQSLADHVSRHYDGLQNLQRCAHDTVIARVQRDLQRDVELRDDRQDLGTTGPALLQKVKHPLDGKEAIRVLLFADTVQEDRKVMVVIKLIHVKLPSKAIADAGMLDLNRQIPAVIKLAELCPLDRPALERFGRRRRVEPRRRDHQTLLLDEFAAVLHAHVVRGGRTALQQRARRQIVCWEISEETLLAHRDKPAALIGLHIPGTIPEAHLRELILDEKRLRRG